MKCLECGFENPEKSKFCGKCGKALGIEPEYPAELQVKSYLQKVIPRFRNEGFDIYENETYNDYLFRYVATKSNFYYKAYGGETFFLFAVFPSIDAYSLRKFSTSCIEYAKKTRRSSRFTTNLFSFPVAIVNSIERVTSAYIQNEAGAIRSFWQVEMESPVVYDLKSSTLYFVEKRYWIGWRGFIRETVKILLAP